MMGLHIAVIIPLAVGAEERSDLGSDINTPKH